jgi:hypothetical protein
MDPTLTSFRSMYSPIKDGRKVIKVITQHEALGLTLSQKDAVHYFTVQHYRDNL